MVKSFASVFEKKKTCTGIFFYTVIKLLLTVFFLICEICKERCRKSFVFIVCRPIAC